MIEKPEWDYYDSDPEAINSLLAKLPYLKNPNLKVLEPCAGTGKFIERFENLVKQINMTFISEKERQIYFNQILSVQTFIINMTLLFLTFQQ